MARKNAVRSKIVAAGMVGVLSFAYGGGVGLLRVAQAQPQPAAAPAGPKTAAPKIDAKKTFAAGMTKFGAGDFAGALTDFQSVDARQSTARAINTRLAGARNVTVIRTAKALHFIDNVAGMYVMTTVHSCPEYDEKRGACIMYGAVNSRVFDSAVLHDPDQVYARIKDKADPGFCDYSFIGTQEAASGQR